MGMKATTTRVQRMRNEMDTDLETDASNTKEVSI